MVSNPWIVSSSRKSDPVMRRMLTIMKPALVDTDCLIRTAFDWKGNTRSARPARKTSLFDELVFGEPTETKKPGPSLL